MTAGEMRRVRGKGMKTKALRGFLPYSPLQKNMIIIIIIIRYVIIIKRKWKQHLQYSNRSDGGDISLKRQRKRRSCDDVGVVMMLFSRGEQISVKWAIVQREKKVYVRLCDA